MRTLTTLTMALAATTTVGLAAAFPAAADSSHSGRTGHHETADTHEHATVEVTDRCDPASFDAALNNPNACSPNHEGRVLFGTLIKFLMADPAGVLDEQEALGWEFDPDSLTVAAGQPLDVTNTGGEVHTFTKVDNFKEGGCVPPVNKIFDLPMSKQCSGPGPTPLLPGTTIQVSDLTLGTNLYQCMIHPWMRATIRVR